MTIQDDLDLMDNAQASGSDVLDIADAINDVTHLQTWVRAAGSTNVVG